MKRKSLTTDNLLTINRNPFFPPEENSFEEGSNDKTVYKTKQKGLINEKWTKVIPVTAQMRVLPNFTTIQRDLDCFNDKEIEKLTQRQKKWKPFFHPEEFALENEPLRARDYTKGSQDLMNFA
jgi:hypothetical protein